MKNSLKNNKDFQKVYNEGISRADRNLVVYILENGLSQNRLGISVSKKVGNSVVRHRLTRLIRECYRLNCSIFRPGFDIVVIARVSAKDKLYKEIENSLVYLLKKHGLSCDD